MKKLKIRGKIQIEAIAGLILFISLVGGGVYLLTAQNNTSPPAAVTLPTTPADPEQTQPSKSEILQGGSGSDIETYYGGEPVIHAVSDVKSYEDEILNQDDIVIVNDETEVINETNNTSNTDQPTSDNSEEIPSDLPDKDALNDWINE